jgi:CRISPR system Cascade subunit CasA
MSFNAHADGWIPVRFTSGEVREVGIAEALLKAPDIESLADPRPIGPPTQLRLLVALIQRVFTPEDASDWRVLWEAGRFDEGALTSYFGRWRERFDLFHPKTPFLQVGGDFAMGNTNPIVKLAHDLDPAGYNTLFSHADGPAVAMAPPEALRVLVLAQACALGGGVSGNPVWNEKTVVRPNFSHAPLATSAVVHFEGASLFETILLNLVPGLVAKDRPVWEQDLTPTYFEAKTAVGPLDRLTNLSRMIRLIPEADGTVQRCYYTQGRALSEGPTDTMVSYRVDKKLGPQSRKVSESRASWRDLHGLLEFAGDDALRAGVLRSIGLRVAEGTLSKAPIPLRVVGIAADKAKVLLWRSDRFSVPTALLERPELVIELGGCMTIADEIASEVGRRVRSMCWHYLAPVKEQMSPDTKDVNALADQLDARTGYWATLEEAYPALLKDIGALASAEPEDVAPVKARWRERCTLAARDSLLASQKRLGETPRAWRALAAVRTGAESFDLTPTPKPEKKN